MKFINFSLLFFLFLIAGIAYGQTPSAGKQQLYYGRIQSAQASLHQAISKEPANGEAWFNLLKTYILSGQFEKGRDTLLSAPAAVSPDPFFRVAEGLVLLQKNPMNGADSYFDNILSSIKKNARDDIAAVIAWTQNNTANGQPKYAIEVLNDAIKKNKRNPELYLLLGESWRKLSNCTEAFKAFQKAAELDKKYAAAYYQMGDIFLSQKNTEVYLDYFQKAVAADAQYSPAWYKLYLYEFNRNPAKAMEYYQHYLTNADRTMRTEYDIADLLYLNKRYDSAINKANEIINIEKVKVKPRLYKLIAYSDAGRKDTASALTSMQKYFNSEEDSNIISKDYEFMSAIYLSMGSDSLGALYLANASSIEKDSSILFIDYKKLADLAKDRKDYQAQAKWLGKYYNNNSNASNLDLFYWGIANYRIENYPMADSVFGNYIRKYPDQSFGYYWQAKSKALQDTSMAIGLAIPAYEKLIEVMNKDTTDENYKKWITEAYGYLAAYAVNSKKDYAEAIGYFQKVLNVDPDNSSAKKYIIVLDKRIKQSTHSDSNLEN